MARKRSALAAELPAELGATGAGESGGALAADAADDDDDAAALLASRTKTEHEQHGTEEEDAQAEAASGVATSGSDVASVPATQSNEHAVVAASGATPLPPPAAAGETSSGATQFNGSSPAHSHVVRSLFANGQPPAQPLSSSVNAGSTRSAGGDEVAGSNGCDTSAASQGLQQHQPRPRNPSPPRSPPRVIRSISGQDASSSAASGMGLSAALGMGMRASQTAPSTPIRKLSGAGPVPALGFNAATGLPLRGTLRPPPISAQTQRPPLQPEAQRQRVTARMQKSATLGLQEALESAAARSSMAHLAGPGTNPSSPRCKPASGPTSELHTPVRPPLAGGGHALLSGGHVLASAPTSAFPASSRSSASSSAWASPSLPPSSASSSMLVGALAAGTNLSHSTFSLDDASSQPALGSLPAAATISAMPSHVYSASASPILGANPTPSSFHAPPSPSLLGRPMMPIVPDFSCIDQARHQSPALRSRSRNPAQGPPPTPTLGASHGRSMNAHGHSHSLHDPPIPLAALFGSAGVGGLGGGGGGSFNLGGFSSDLPASTPSTPGRTGFKRRMIDKSDLDRDMKLFSFVALASVGAGEASAQAVKLGPEHSFSIARAQSQASAQGAAAQPHPSSSRSPLFGPALVGPDGTPRRNGRGVRSPGLSAASCKLLFAPLSLPASAAPAAAASSTPTGSSSLLHPASASTGSSFSFSLLSLPPPSPVLRPKPPTGLLQGAAGGADSTSTNPNVSQVGPLSPTASASAPSSRHVPFVHFTPLARLGSGSFGDVLAMRVDRDEWNQAHYPPALMPTGESGSTLEFAVKKARLPMKGAPMRQRIIRQMALLHGLFTAPDPRFLAPLTSDLTAKDASTAAELPSSAEVVAPARWHPSLVQLHSVWQEAPGILFEAMELCEAPREFCAYRALAGGSTTNCVATLEEYFLVLREQVSDAVAGRPAPALPVTASAVYGSDAGGLASSPDAAFKTPRSSDDTYGDDDDGEESGSEEEDVAMGGARASALVRMSDHDDSSESDNEDAVSVRRPISNRGGRGATHLQFPEFLPPASATTRPPPPAWTVPPPGGVNPCEAELLRVVEQVGSALLFMHHHGLLHFDVKPGNIFCVPAGETPVSIPHGAAPWNFAHTRYKLGDYGSLVSVADYVRSKFSSSSSSAAAASSASSLLWAGSGATDDGASVASADTLGGGGGRAFEPDDGDGDFLAPELLNPLPFLRPPRRGSTAAAHSLTLASLIQGSGGSSSMDDDSSIAVEDPEAAAENEDPAAESARLSLATQLAPAIDVYSFGMTIFSLITGKLFRQVRELTPEQQQDFAGEAVEESAALEVQQSQAEAQLASLPLNFPASAETRALVARMLEQDPRNRPTMRNVVEQAHAILERAHAAQVAAAGSVVAQPAEHVTSPFGLSSPVAVCSSASVVDASDMEGVESVSSLLPSSSLPLADPAGPNDAATLAYPTASFVEPPPQRAHEVMVRTSPMQRLSVTVSHSRSHEVPLSTTLAAASATAAAAATQEPVSASAASESTRGDPRSSSSGQSTPLSPMRGGVGPRRLFPTAPSMSVGASGGLGSKSMPGSLMNLSALAGTAPSTTGHSTSSSLGSTAQLFSCIPTSCGSNSGSECSSTVASPPISATVSPILSFAAPDALSRNMASLPLIAGFSPLVAGAPGLNSKPLGGHATFPRSFGRGFTAATASAGAESGRDARRGALLAQMQLSTLTSSSPSHTPSSSSPPNGLASSNAQINTAHVPALHTRNGAGGSSMRVTNAAQGNCASGNSSMDSLLSPPSPRPNHRPRHSSLSIPSRSRVQVAPHASSTLPAPADTSHPQPQQQPSPRALKQEQMRQMDEAVELPVSSNDAGIVR